jgi:polar amino acid transport system substrate-binding protein
VFFKGGRIFYAVLNQNEELGPIKALYRMVSMSSGSYELFVAQQLDVLSGLKPRLLMDVETLPGARILDGRFTAIQQGIGTPQARTAAAAYLSAFVEEAKSSGLVAQTIARHGVRGVNVAPAAAR